MEKMKYIGVRLSFDEIESILDRPMSRLNGRTSESFRDCAMRMGIQKTKNGKRLEFYQVTESEYLKLLQPKTRTWTQLKNNFDYHPLISFDRDVMVDCIRTVNSRYNRRMDRKEYAQYQTELEQALEKSLEYLGNDRTRAIKETA